MRSIVAGSAMLMMSAASAFAQVTNAPQVGGQGGGAFDDACRPGDVMVGYNVVDGKSVVRFAAVCQAQSNGVLVGNNYGLKTWGEDNHDGAAFHGFETPRCPATSAIVKLDVWVNKFNELDSVAATCASLLPHVAGSSTLQRTTTSGGQAVRQGPSECPPGTVAVGISGRSGALVDSVGLKCSPFPWHEAAVPPKPPTQKFVTVLKDVDVYDRPAPPSGDKPKGMLAKGTAKVALVKQGPPGWYQLSWPGDPPGDDWIYSANDFTSLDPASLKP